MKQEIMTCQELIEDINSIIHDIHWANANDESLLPWLYNCLHIKEQILKEWSESNYE